jgi:acyl transferase domain-containing protein/thioesterase domain-containing protein/SAM-dependent methyltransferase/NAD(P)-dependent dehydrogenase (short-subunit alcohol dehydrogenase family)
MRQANDARKRSIFGLVAEGRLTAEDAAVLLRGGGAPASRSIGQPLAIAVVGLAARYADAPDTDALWEMLRAGRSAVSRMPSTRHPEAASLDRCGGFVPDADTFDPTFFRISPTEAALMDPQQRLFLEQAWLALEDAGLAGDRASELRCGVYVGAGSGDFADVLKAAGVRANPQALMGNVASILAARISYFLNLKGPSLAVDTACSSSLVAVHLAIEALERGEVDVALAGGVCVINTPEFMRTMAQGGMLSPSNSCHTFDAAADGFACGEGAAAVVLKPLAAAQADGDHIWGIIRGSAINQDGRTNGITAPNGPSQEALETEVYRRYGIDPRGISYVEAHGTGTPLGDPIEVDALTAAFRQFTADTGFCRLGSVKTNIGHTLTAAGVAGLAKVLLQLRHQTFAPSLNFETANPRIDLEASPFTVPTRAEPWPRVAGVPRRAAISSFGFSGTNAHIVVEEGPDRPPRPPAIGPFPIILSARTQDALRRRAAAIRAAVTAAPEMELRDLSFTLASGRARLPVSAGFMADDRAALLAGLDRIVSSAAPATNIDPSGTDFANARRVPLPGDPFERMRIPLPALPAAVEPAAIDPAVLHAHGAIFAAAEDWGRAALVEAMRRLGLFDTGRTAFTRAWARRRLAVTEARARLFDALIDMLARSGVLTVEGAVVRLATIPSPMDRPAQPAAKPFVDLLSATIAGLPDVLTGRRTAMEVLFPNGRGDLVEAVYRGNPLADHLNDLLAHRVLTLAEGRRTLRVLEVGAGTGGTTHAVLGRLGPGVSYLFTDVARAFVGAARRTFGGDPRVGFAVFDLEAPVPPEVAAAGPFDVVIASNVLHATRRIGDVLARLHGVMAPGAVLVLNEVTRAQDFATLTFGLTDGWWAFEDERLPGSPVLSVVGWRHALTAAGFPSVEADGLAREDGELIQAVLSATRDQTPATLAVPMPVTAAPRTVAKPASGELERFLAETVAGVLTMAPADIDRRARFMDYGLDSILGVSLVEKLNAALGIDLRPTVVFDYPTVADLGGHLATLTAANRPGLEQTALPRETAIARDRRIAVIGLAARYADAGDLAAFRDMLRAGRSGIGEVPPSRWHADPGPDGQPDPFQRWGGFLANAEGFDPLALRISGKEAELTDPQHRVFLMEAWHALEDAGYGEAALDGMRCGVFVGAHGGDYTHRMVQAGIAPQAFAFMGNAASILAARIAYMLNLKGPAMAIDTACSSSLVAVHLACRSLLDDECDMALAGGVFVNTTKGFNIAAGTAGMLSPNGRCATFDAAADGFVPGEGSGVAVLKRLDRALADGDHIDAVIVASGLNQDGKTNGITAPSPESQAALIRDTYRRNDIDPRGIGYIEAHGTGTPLGDPIEIEGLTRAWAGWPVPPGSAAIGSVKTNVGHAAHAAGIGGFIKAVLAVRDGEIYPSLHFRTENPKLRLGDTPFRVPTTLEPWRQADGQPRRAAVSAFGFSGTNCHIVIEEAAPVPRPEAAPGPQLFMVSAKTATALVRRMADLAAWLDGNDPRLDDLAHTLAAGRTQFERRWAVVAGTVAALRRALAGKQVSGPDDAAWTRLESLAARYRAGETIDLEAIGAGGRRISIPTYPFELVPYWIDIVRPGPSAEPLGMKMSSRGAERRGDLQDGAQLAGDRHVACAPRDDNPAIRGPIFFVADAKTSPMSAGSSDSVHSAAMIVKAAGDRAAGPATLMAPRWHPAPVTSPVAAAGTFAVAGGTPVMVRALEAAWRSAGGDGVAVAIDPGVTAVVVLAGTATGEALFDAVRAVLAAKGPAVPVLVVHEGAPSDAALVAFGRSIAFFGGRAHVRALEVGAITPEAGPAIIRELTLGVAGPPEIRLTGGERLRRVLEPVMASPLPLPLTDGAHCLVTGGGGVLARVLAVRLGRRHGARIALIGRSVPNEAVAATIAAIEAAGGKAAYWQADVADPEQVASALARAEASFGALAAVFHLAGVPGQGIVSEKRWDDMRAAMRAKAGGLTALDAAIGDRPLQLFVTFASLAAELGDFGQCDYATANAFADRFAIWREAERQAGRRQGRTVAVDWPLWAEGRQVLSSEGAALFSVASGLRALATTEALDLLDAAVASGEAQVAVFPTDADAARAMLAERVAEPPRLTATSSAAGGGAGVVSALVAMVAALMKLPAERLPVDANLADFGFDSIALKDFAVRISEHWGVTVSPAAFFAHGTITRLADYLTAEHGIGGSVAAKPVPEPAADAWAPVPDPKLSRTSTDDRAIAIVGMAGRFPGAPDVDSFWHHLESGHDLVGPMPEDRVAIAGRRGGRGGYLDGVDRFDHAFFGISVRDAQLMDPQHRLAIEATSNAFESAGINVSALAGRRVGVFFASQVNEYAALVPFEETARAQMALGNIAALLPNRISWLFDFRGPSEAIDTACSGSLVALHRAILALRHGEAEVAVAGGVSLMLSSDAEETVKRLGVGSSDGRCRVFDAGADGYVKGEGVAAVVLKPLTAALADGDPVLAVIRGSAVGHGGHAQTITAPDALAEADVIAAAIADAGVPAASLGMIEAHGTGTQLGDPVEIEGLKAVFRRLGGGTAGTCAVGSVKSNIGHLEPAAGLAGLIKTVQALRHGVIPPTIHFTAANPLIELAGSPLRIADRALAWPRAPDGTPRRAGVSSFGFGGAYAHVVLEEAPAVTASPASASPLLIVWSARSADRLPAVAARLAAAAREGEAVPADIAWTLMTGRAALPYRAALVLRADQDLGQRLDAAASMLSGGSAASEVFIASDSVALEPGVAADRLVQELIATGRLGRVARLWVAGAAIDWTAADVPRGRRVTLPGMPFAGPRHWFRGRPGATAPVAVAQRHEASAAVSADPKIVEARVEPPPLIAVVPVDPPPRAIATPVDPPPLPVAALAPSSRAVAHDDALHRIRAMVAAALYVEADNIDVTAGLADLGLDSILAVELARAINIEFGTTLQAARLYDHPTIEALASFVTGAAAPQPMPAAPGPVLAQPPRGSSGEDGAAIHTAIRRIVADALYIEPDMLDETAGFGDLGLDSILAVEVVKAINDRFRVGLEAARLYDHPTIAALAAFVAARVTGPAVLAPAIIQAAPAAVRGGRTDDIPGAVRAAVAAALGRVPESIDLKAPLASFAIGPELAASILDKLATVAGFRPGLDAVGRCADLDALAVLLAAGGGPPPRPVAPPQPAVPVTPPRSPLPEGDPIGAIRAIVADVLSVAFEDIDPDAPLATLGVDLVQAGEIAYRLNRAHGGGLKARALLEAGTVRTLAALVLPNGAAGPAGERPAPARADTAVRSPDITQAVAVIGLACRFPGAADATEFWRNISDGVCSIVEIPPDRWPAGLHDGVLTDDRQRAAVRWGGFIDGVDRFDPLFFGLSPKEAEFMDPQQRLFLQEAWHALEDAGLTRDALRGSSCGVFVGAGQGDYVHLLPRDGAGLSGQMLLGNTSSILAARIAYFLDLKGPSLALDTACSSALVALHYAARSIRDGECALALAGGVSLMLTPQMHLMTAASGMLAADGRCKTFDDGADGFVPGEGVGVVVLKRLDLALADGDRVYGVIAGSAVNQDGRTSSITAPSAASQARLEASLYRSAGIDAGRIGYVEAHGTGTKLGDPIEISALTEAFAASGATGPCAIGSVKTNIGHTLAAAGSAGLIKTLLAIHHAALPPSLFFARANAHIRFEDTPFQVQTALAAWPPDRPLAAVSSFGFSGTNAHVVVAPPPPNAASGGPGLALWPIVLSAPSEPALRRWAGVLADRLSDPGGPSIRDLAHTLARRRTAFKARAVLIAADVVPLVPMLRAVANGAAPAVNEALPAALAAATLAFAIGQTPDWSDLPRGHVVSLPGYPFEQRRFWIEPAQPAAAPDPDLVIRRDDAVIAGHVVGGRPLLPGAASLLLAARHAGSDWAEVSGLAWLAPIEVTGERRLIARRDRAGAFTLADRDTGAPLVRATVRAGTPPSERLDPSQLTAALPTAVPADAVYDFLAAAGIAYGPSFQRVEWVRVGGDRALVRLRSARPMTGLDADAVGHLDAALHALAAFAVVDSSSATLMLPASLDKALIGPATATAVWALITLHPAGAVATLAADVVLADADGTILARIDGLRATAPAAGPRTFVLAPEWAPAALPAGAVDAGPVAILHGPEATGWAGAFVAAAQADGRKSWAAGLDRPLADAVGDAGTVVFCGWGAGESADGLAAVADAEKAGVTRLLALSRHLIATGRPRRLRVLTRGAQAVGPDDRVLPGYAALSGFARTLAREHPALDPVVVDLPSNDAETREAARRHCAMLLGETGTPDNVDIAYRDGSRFARRFAMLAPGESAGDRMRKAGLYLIIGGAGGIGRALSLDLARRYGARLAWVGRRAADNDIAAAVTAVEAAGGSARYYKADAQVPADLARVVRSVEAEWGTIHGVIHAAIVLADCRIEAMEEAKLAAALRAKSRVAAALATALKGRAPDFLAVFSSSNAFTCNPGQANYAAGCTFLDAWALAWGQAAGIPAFVIDWGFWGQTGIVASDEYRQRAVAAGVDPMTTAEGIDLFHLLLGAGVRQAAVMRFGTAGRAKVEAELARRLTPAIQTSIGNAVAAARVLSAPATPPDESLRSAAAEIEAIEVYARRRLLHAFVGSGVLMPGRHAIETLAQRAAVAPGYRRLFDALLDMLARSGALKLRDGVAEIDGLPAEATPERPVVSRLAAHLELLDACLGGLTDVLSGQRSYVEVMFPGGSAHLVEAVYRDNPSSDVYNALLAEAGAAFAQGSTGPIQVLEIGAGTGGATVGLVAALGQTETAFTYTYTDVSPRFLEHGRRLFPDRPELRYALLDIDADPVFQGFAAGGFDMVVASNVLHAGRDLGAVIDHAKRLLKRDGVLLLNEMTARSDLATLTFGLTEGWWAFTDQGVRLPHAPLLDGDGWRGALWRAGFHGATVGGPGGGQSVVLAISDGWLPVRLTAPVHAVVGQPTFRPESVSAPADKSALSAWLIGVFAETLKLEPGEIDPAESYDRYGVDSLVAMEIRTQLEKSIGPLATPLLFEGVSLDGLAEVLMREKPAEIAALLGTAKPAARTVPVPAQLARHAVPIREPIAIIGLSGRYPGGADPEAFWHTLSTGASAVVTVPPERGDWQGAGASRAALIDHVDRFDPLFFQIAPAEAAAMDPQERLFLEVAWAAIEDAGTTPRRLGGAARRVGVFAGAMRSDYQRYGTIDFAHGGPGLAGSAAWSIANRLSFLLDFHGPSMAVDTACSASLAAVHMACEHLHAGRIDAAIAGGAHLILHPQSQVAMARMGLLSPTGQGRPFAADADGFVEGEGVGAVVLKRLSDAERDGDRIRAVILGGAVNASGRTSGYMIPNPAAEAELIDMALADAGVTAVDIDYIEAQASGSPIGDPVEFAALSRAFRGATGKRPIGSLKGTIGHLSAASGVAQLTKVVLQLEHGHIAPMAAPGRPSAEIDLDASPFRFVRGEPWPARAGHQRVATISAYGAGGANAMLVVAEAPEPQVQPTALRGEGHIVVVSARTAERLRLAAERLAGFLQTRPNLDLAAIAWTLQAGREAMAYRLALTADDVAGVVAGIGDFLANRPGTWRQGTANGYATTGLGDDPPAEVVMAAWVKGAPIDWPGLWRGTPPLPVSLPAYPFERRRCWIEMTPEPARTVTPPPSSMRRAMVISRPADIDGLAVADVPLDPPNAGEIEIAVAAFALNFGDLLSLRGAYPNMPPYPFVPGFEAAGRVAALGAGVTDFAIGDPVVALTGGRGGQADRVVVPSGHAMRLPDGYNMTEAAAFPIGWLTARHTLDRAGVAPGETVLVTSAGGGVGPFVVQLALAANARVLATAGSSAKLDALRGLGAGVLNYRTDDVSAWVRAETRDRGADVVVNLLGGDAVQQGIDLLAPGGRYVEIALAGLMSAGRLDLSRFLDNQSFITVNLGRVLASAANTRTEFAGMAAAMAAGTVRPLIDTVVPFSRIEDAYGRLARRENVGKVVVAVDAAAIRPAPPAPRPQLSEPLLAELTRVAAGVLGLRAEEITPDRPLDELGLTSVSGLEIARRIEAVAGQPVPVTLLWRHRTLGGLAAALSGPTVQAPPTVRSPLVTIRATGTTAPVFLVHGAPGEVSWVVDLAQKLGDTIPVHAFEAPGLHGGAPIPETVEAFATIYADLLMKACPSGPYWLGGYSGGGAIAFALARIMAARGRPAAGLLLLDANAPGNHSLSGMDQGFGDGFIYRLAGNWLARRWDRPMLAAGALVGLDDAQRVTAVLDHLYAGAPPPMPRQEAVRLIQGMDRVARVIGRALADYRTDPIVPPLRTVLFRCTQGMAPADNPLDLPAFLTDGDYRAGWDTLTGAPPEVHPIDCDHFSLVLEPHASRLAAAIRAVVSDVSSAGLSGEPPAGLSGEPPPGSRAHVARVVLDRVRLGLPEVPPAEIRPDRSMTELGATSIDRVEVTLAAMEALGADIPPRDLAGLTTIDALIDVLHRHIGERRAP